MTPHPGRLALPPPCPSRRPPSITPPSTGTRAYSATQRRLQAPRSSVLAAARLGPSHRGWAHTPTPLLLFSGVHGLWSEDQGWPLQLKDPDAAAWTRTMAGHLEPRREP
ncbi:hypothetical protein SORBI_3003G217700 [Sorghum bicolor]|uniref:Uncharacterized protein n=1 Tax=Sorghum bicolor TaxID=4558 RepID=A0A1B6Q4L9_SORBI|nr:hypothetical protein SORBI_3003G217700 [Sorghum bicolor]OQU87156.1 hypothetical protein SORBI_3003G217700 [Sorghum bicolor]OQU87157.1 hypothetical protein SORBI_3003G217700 [Sorghum bicolor]